MTTIRVDMDEVFDLFELLIHGLAAGFKQSERSFSGDEVGEALDECANRLRDHPRAKELLER
jgi:hypothetical protein